MKNGTLRFIPLQSDLCLNKQKVDISDFKGWQKCNAPVYGDCLSPLYKKNENHHDIYIGNDTYDFSEGKLYKNGTEVLSGAGSNKIKKTKFARQDITSVSVKSDSSDFIACKETGSTSFDVIFNNDVHSYTINNAQRIVKTKCFGDSSFGGCIALYLHANGKYGYFVAWQYNETMYTSYGEYSPTLFDWEITSPLIQVAYKSGIGYIVSIFNNSGANITETQVKNFVIANSTIYDNVTFNSDLSVVRYNTIANPCNMRANVTNREIHGVYSYGQDDPPTPPSFYYKIQQEIEFSWEGNFPLTSISLVGNNGAIDTLTVTQTENTRKNIKTRITYEGVYVDANTGFTTPTYVIERYGASAWETVATGSGTYVGQGMFGHIGRFYKVPDATVSPVKIVYSYISNSVPDDPTSAGEDIAWSAMATINEGVTVYSNYAVNFPYDNQRSPVFPLSSPTDTIFSGIFDAEGSTVSCFVPIGNPSFILGGESNGEIDIAYGIGQNYYNWSMSSPYTFYKYTKEVFTNPSLKDCDCILDDGRCYCVTPLVPSTDTPIPMKMLSLAGTPTSFDTTSRKITYTSIATFNISYEVTNNIYPKYYSGMSMSLQDKYLRIIYKFKADFRDENEIFFLVDSADIVTAEGKNVYLYPGVVQESDTNIQGACVNWWTNGGAYGDTHFRLLFNNNIISNIACYEKADFIGTILADWFTIDPDFNISWGTDRLVYKDNTGNVWLVQFTDTPEWEYRVVENRYIVLNTTNYFNCYDTYTGLKRHWASDYNNRIMYGYGFSQYSVNAIFSDLLTKALFRGLIITGQNANYEMTQDTITSLELGAVIMDKCLKDYVSFFSCNTPYGAIEGIDLYRGDEDSTSALYICSYQNGLKYIDTDLTNPTAVYPIGNNGDVRYNPNLFTLFITSYNNKDMVISDGVAYKLVYYNNVIPIMSYYLLDGVESLVNAFVLQSTFYGVSETKLYQMNYSYGVGVEVVCDITNMEYLGALPTQALFWSAQNRAIYSFKGSCIMQLTQYANDLTNIFGKWYNPATQELFLDTNIGILVFSDLGTYCLEWSTETIQKSVRDIFFFTDYFIVNLIGDTTYSHYYSYNNKEGYESNKVYFITKYYGNGLVPITVNNIYIRLYDQADAGAEGFIKFKGYTITDKGTTTDLKEVHIGGEDNPTTNPPTVAGEQWDAETGTMLVKYTPQYNRGLGFALEVETTFPIIDIKFDYVENGTIESQIAHINI